jgi:hypothetical protein
MKFYYRELGIHTHVRVYLHGALCGRLCFRNEEGRQVMIELALRVEFIPNLMDRPEDEPL